MLSMLGFKSEAEKLLEKEQLERELKERQERENKEHQEREQQELQEKERQWKATVSIWQDSFRLDRSVNPHLEMTLVGHKGSINALAALKDGRLASGGGGRYEEDKYMIRVWNTANNICEKILLGHKDTITTLLALEDGRLASGSEDKTIRVWDVVTGKCVIKLSAWSNNFSIQTLTELSNGCLVSSGSDGLRIWDIEKRMCVQQFFRDETRCPNLPGYTIQLADGRLVGRLAGRYGFIGVWNVANGTCVARTWGHTHSVARTWGHTHTVSALTVLPSGLLASAQENPDRLKEKDYRIQIWRVDWNSLSCIKKLEGHTSEIRALTALPDGLLVSAGGNCYNVPDKERKTQDFSIRLWDIDKGTCVKVLSGHTDDIHALVLLANGQLASAGGCYIGNKDYDIRIWDLGYRSKHPLPQKNIVTAEVSQLASLQSNTISSLKNNSKEHQSLEDSGISSKKKVTTSGKEKKWSFLSFFRTNETNKIAPSSDANVLPSMSSQLGQLPNIARDGNRFEDHVDLPAGLLITEDKIQMGRELGQGGFGTVYEAIYNFQTVAVKRYEGSRLPERVAQEVKHEVSIMLRLQHDCLIKLLGLVLNDRHPGMLVMEYAANGSLYDYLQSSREISWNLRLRIAMELTRGLAYLHQERIIHCDIKSLNVVLDNDYHAKWCDFGLATLKLHSTTTTKQTGGNGVAGTDRWKAPELFSGETKHTQASDVWALGMIFFEIASQEIPFKDKAGVALGIYIGFGNGKNGEEIPAVCREEAPGLGNIMKRCWAERTVRPSAEILVSELRPLLEVVPSAPTGRLSVAKPSTPVKKEIFSSYQTPSFNPHR